MRHRKAPEQVAHLVREAIVDGRVWEDTQPEVEFILTSGHMDMARLPALVMDGVKLAARHFLDDNILDEHEETRINGFLSSLEIGRVTLPYESLEKLLGRLSQAAILRMVLEGINPVAHSDIRGNVSFNFMKSEDPIWYFADVKYYNVRKQVHYSGGSSGIGVRVGKGMYMRTGGFKGQRYTTEETTLTDTGCLCIATKHIYFAGSSHRFRVRHDRVVCYTPLERGFSLTRARADAQPELFITGDGWFSYNLVANAQNVSA